MVSEKERVFLEYLVLHCQHKDQRVWDEMIRNCEKLLVRRIKDIPKEGDEIDILYSEKDPLQENDSGEADDEAYTIYFTVVEIEPSNEKDIEKLTITMELNY